MIFLKNLGSEAAGRTCLTDATGKEATAGGDEVADGHATEVKGALINAERSHAGPVMPDTPGCNLPAFAAVMGYLDLTFASLALPLWTSKAERLLATHLLWMPQMFPPYPHRKSYCPS